MTREAALRAIESRYGFVLPEIYRRMQHDGVCDYGASVEEWLATCASRTFESPPALLGAIDFEWLALDYIVEWEAPDYFRSDLGLVPFAQSARADLYAWLSRDADPSVVVLVSRDQNKTTFFAPHLEGLLYRETLEALTYPIPLEEEDQFASHEDRTRAREAEVETIRPYLRPRWHDDLVSLVAREPRAWTSGDRMRETFVAQLDETELRDRMVRELAFPRLDTTFEHALPLP